MTPVQVAAGCFLGMVLTSDLPDLAARWLAAGLDTEALRKLAGHPPGDAWGVEHSWIQVAHELAQDAREGLCGIGDSLDEEEAWLRMLPVGLARWRLGEVSAAMASECLLRAGRESTSANALVGLEELLWLEEHRFDLAADPGRLDHGMTGRFARAESRDCWWVGDLAVS